jgi:uncharacterized lipoprotein YajG
MFSIVFIGCTKKVEVKLQPYVTLNQNEKQDKKIVFVGVEDKRATQIVAVVVDDGIEKQKFGLSNNIIQWYQEGIIRELKSSDMYGSKSGAVKVSVNIVKIDATYKNDKLDKKNMQVSIGLEVIIKENNITTKSNITINQTAYKMMVSDASDFEDILNEAVRSSVSKTVAILIEKMGK